MKPGTSALQYRGLLDPRREGIGHLQYNLSVAKVCLYGMRLGGGAVSPSDAFVTTL